MEQFKERISSGISSKKLDTGAEFMRIQTGGQTTWIKETLERTPPELSADIIDHGITLTGGGALLRGLDQLIQSETGIDVHVAEDPLDCVAKGAGAVLDHVDVLHDVLDTDGAHM